MTSEPLKGRVKSLLHSHVRSLSEQRSVTAVSRPAPSSVKATACLPFGELQLPCLIEHTPLLLSSETHYQFGPSKEVKVVCVRAPAGLLIKVPSTAPESQSAENGVAMSGGMLAGSLRVQRARASE